LKQQLAFLPSIYLWGKAGGGRGKGSYLIYHTPEIFQKNAFTRSVAAEELTETPPNLSDRSDDHSLSQVLGSPALTCGHPRLEQEGLCYSTKESCLYMVLQGSGKKLNKHESDGVGINSGSSAYFWVFCFHFSSMVYQVLIFLDTWRTSESSE
jgi:hypothetical protein